MLGVWKRSSGFTKRKHPEKIAAGHVSALNNDTCLPVTCFQNPENDSGTNILTQVFTETPCK